MRSLFISPHPDDIAYSCFIPIFRNKGYKHILTIFGESKYAYGTSDNDIDTITDVRMQEEYAFARFINAEISYCRFSDSSITYRPNSSMDGLYPNKQDIRNCILDVFQSLDYTDVYFPIAQCWHYDHILIHNIVLESLLPIASSKVQFHMYEDYPYVADMTDKEIKESILCNINSKTNKVSSYFEMIDMCLVEQETAINIYKSQKNDIDICKILDRKTHNNCIKETIWNVETIK